MTEIQLTSKRIVTKEDLENWLPRQAIIILKRKLEKDFLMVYFETGSQTPYKMVNLVTGQKVDGFSAMFVLINSYAGQDDKWYWFDDLADLAQNLSKII